mmetsp:Transcript_34583/g.91260  ORF Transcript_34583/g.91260 Transcript_34583/m.91260 type:complete len:108 (+) Transcript_34583:347-670(+)
MEMEAVVVVETVAAATAAAATAAAVVAVVTAAAMAAAAMEDVADAATVAKQQSSALRSVAGRCCAGRIPRERNWSLIAGTSFRLHHPAASLTPAPFFLIPAARMGRH